MMATFQCFCTECGILSLHLVNKCGHRIVSYLRLAIDCVDQRKGVMVGDLEGKPLTACV